MVMATVLAMVTVTVMVAKTKRDDMDLIILEHVCLKNLLNHHINTLRTTRINIINQGYAI
jgi:hypothetical protein